MNTIETNTTTRSFDHYMRLALLVTVLIMYSGILLNFIIG